MLDSIYVAMSGLSGYSRGLRVIANNTANINTPGYKGSSLQFGDLVYGSGHASIWSQPDASQFGQGLGTYGTTLNFSQGELRQSGSDLDLAVDGQGLFTLRTQSGELVYTRDGAFEFNEEGFLVSRTNGAKVLARDTNGGLVEVSLADLRGNPAKATQTVTFRGNLSSDDSSAAKTHTLSSVTVIDALGGKHTLTLTFTRQASTQLNEVLWQIKVSDGTTEVATKEISFFGNEIDAASAKVAVDYAPPGMSAMTFTLDFSKDVTSWPGGSYSDLAFVKQDGYASGSLTGTTFDADGVLNLAYSNGQTVKGVRLALARFSTTDAVRALGSNQFAPTDPTAWETGSAQSGAFGAIKSRAVEISNVDLSSEFSDLVIMQRGYQASSQVLSTANDMIQELFALKGK